MCTKKVVLTATPKTNRSPLCTVPTLYYSLQSSHLPQRRPHILHDMLSHIIVYKMSRNIGVDWSLIVCMYIHLVLLFLVYLFFRVYLSFIICGHLNLFQCVHKALYKPLVNGILFIWFLNVCCKCNDFSKYHETMFMRHFIFGFCSTCSVQPLTETCLKRLKYNLRGYVI